MLHFIIVEMSRVDREKSYIETTHYLQSYFLGSIQYKQGRDLTRFPSVLGVRLFILLPMWGNERGLKITAGYRASDGPKGFQMSLYKPSSVSSGRNKIVRAQFSRKLPETI